MNGSAENENKAPKYGQGSNRTETQAIQAAQRRTPPSFKFFKA